MKRKHNRHSPETGEMQSPHDRFLKHTLEDLSKARATLEGILPPALFSRLRLETLTAADTSYLDPRLREYFSDVVYTCQTQEKIPLQIAFLFEHKSYPPHVPHLQLLRYMLEIWDREARENKPLSLVIPILLYHGKEAWEYRPFDSYFSGELDEGLRSYAPLFDFLTLNLQAASFEEI
ncbi:MAG: Rpn family recombination-promoting nuclease/putative transposase, partial [Bacteroidia bacterium]|nr:Rpn family recombination-promoting nuclease/putative transposase [Bacteroidia bacterium]